MFCFRVIVLCFIFIGLCFAESSVQIINDNLVFLTNAAGSRIGYSYGNETIYFDTMSKTVDQLTMMYNLGKKLLITAK